VECGFGLAEVSMNKKYQVFISSTYSDLVEERAEITKSILDLGHIPAGMESFLSADVEQFSYIKKVIDQCDYYVLIIAGRYGSEDVDGIGYTEKEFDYAVSTGKVVLALIHSDLGSLPAKFVDDDAIKKEKLKKFGEKVKTGRLVSFWTSKDDLKAKVIISLSKATSESPGVGWIRGNAAASEDILAEINRLRIENDSLKADKLNLSKQLKPDLNNIADFDDKFKFKYNYRDDSGARVRVYEREVTLSWKEIFSAVGPRLVRPSLDAVISTGLVSYLGEVKGKNSVISIFDHDKNVIKIHLSALGLIKIEAAEAKGGGISEFISLTALGRAKLTEIMAVRKAAIPISDS
jgi:hypothetical protein